MAYWYDEFIFDDSDRVCFMADDVSDLASLPTVHSWGTPQGQNNVLCEPVSAGSLCYVIETNEKYMLNSMDTWIKLVQKGGGGTPTPVATSLSELADVSINAAKDGDFLVYDSATGKWINKEADTVVVSYTNMDNKPSIGGVEITGDMTLDELGIAPAATYDQPTETIGL